MTDYVLAADKATGMTYPITRTKAAANRYDVLPDSPYDRNGQLRAPVRTPKTPAQKGPEQPADKATAGKPKEASK